MGATSEAMHRPKKVTSLSEYKEEASGCLTWCGSLSGNCFRGCLSTCITHLKAPPCPGFVLDANKCKDTCDLLQEGYSCLETVDANSTQMCHAKLTVTVPEDGCPYKS